MEYDRVGVSEGSNVNKTNESRKDIYLLFICNYYYFLETSFRFQTKACNDCHDLMQKAMSFDDVMRFDVNCFFVKRTDYRMHFWYMSKDVTINIIKNSDIKEESVSL